MCGPGSGELVRANWIVGGFRLSDGKADSAGKDAAGAPGGVDAEAGQGAQDLVRQGTVVSSMTLLSRITGFVRDIVLSHVFGAAYVADAFFVAFRIPNFFRRLFAEGAFSQAFVPVLARYRAKPDAVMRAFVSRIFGNLTLAVSIMVLIGVLLPPQVVVVFAPGFPADGPRAVLTAELVRITFPYLGLITLVALAGAVLNSHHRYAIPAFTPVMLNLCLITAAIIGFNSITPDSGAAVLEGKEPVAYALAWGVLAAGMVQLALQIPALGRINMLVPPRLSTQDPGVREVGRLLIPAVLAASVAQINALVDSILASFLIPGSISWLYYSDRLLELPIGLVAVALGTVLLPNLSRLATEARFDDFRRTLDWGMRMAFLLALPAAAALYVLALPLIAGIFLHGAMLRTDAQLAALSLGAFAPGLIGWVLVKVLAPAYFARKDTQTPLRFASIAVAINIVLNLCLFWWMGHVGLALATSASGLANAALLARALARSGHLQAQPGFKTFMSRVVVATGIMTALLLWIDPGAAYWLDTPLLQRTVSLLGLVGGGALVYLVSLLVLGVRPAQLRFSV